MACTSLCHKALCAIKPDNQNSSQWKCSVEADAVFFGNDQPSVINWCWNYPRRQEDENLLRWKIKLRLRLKFIGEFSLMFNQTGAWLMWRMKGCVQVKGALFESQSHRCCSYQPRQCPFLKIFQNCSRFSTAFLLCVVCMCISPPQLRNITQTACANT